MPVRQIITAIACGLVFSLPLCHAQPAATAEVLPEPAPALHPWQAALPRLTAEAYFSNLKDDAKIETPFRMTFGLSGGWGLAPISKPLAGKSGHHHLLVNRELPLDFKAALPFNDQYIHFGKGQMETVLNLEPGTYNLRLLLADSKHLPHFVYSKPLKVTVTKKNKEIDPKSLVTKSIEVLSIEPGATLKAPFRLQFHASGLNVAHRSQKEADTGHFRLTLTPDKGGNPAVIDLINGLTEVWLAPPGGSYSVQIDLLDNLNTGKKLAEAKPVSIRVE